MEQCSMMKEIQLRYSNISTEVVYLQANKGSFIQRAERYKRIGSSIKTDPHRMDKLFLYHPGGDTIFNCKECQTPLASIDKLVSKNFTGNSGEAYMFSEVVNVTKSNMAPETMATGTYLIRKISCIKCYQEVGWRYEFSVNPSQRFKESKSVLELSQIEKEDLIPLLPVDDSD